MDPLPVSRSAGHVLVWTILVIVCLGVSGEVDSSLIHFTGRTMGTTYSVKVVQLPENVNRRRLAAEIERVLDTVNRRMSTYLPDSEIMRFNSAAATDWIGISPPLLEVLEEALHWSVKTGGAFDVTAGPLVNLWGFGPRPSFLQVPADPLIERALQRVGYELLEIRSAPPSVRKERADVFVDLSAIGKGYAVDRVFRTLIGAGVNSCLVEIGGELRGLGQNARGQPWTVAIERPIPGGGASRRRIGLSEGAVATSGDYRHFFEKGGRRYAHILDPRTGRPVQHSLASVTVVDSTAMRADALATALIVLGSERGYEFAMREGIAAFFFVRNGDDALERVTPRFESLLLVEE